MWSAGLRYLFMLPMSWILASRFGGAVKSAKGSKTPPISLVSVEYCGLWTFLCSSDLGICIRRKLVCCGHMAAYHCSRYFTDSTLMTANARNSRVIVV